MEDAEGALENEALIEGAGDMVGSTLAVALEASVGVLPFKVGDKRGEGVNTVEVVGSPVTDPAAEKVSPFDLLAGPGEKVLFPPPVSVPFSVGCTVREADMVSLP